MFNVYRKEIDFAGKKLVLETGKVARQADGAVLATLGGTTVMCCVTAAKSVREGQDFFPLTVHYQEKPMVPAKSRAVFSSAKAVRVRKKPSPHV